MPAIRFAGKTLDVLPDESVLDALLRTGNTVSYSCKSGICRTCVLRAVHGEVPREAQEGLKAPWKERGLFLSCRAIPKDDMEVTTVDDMGLSVDAIVVQCGRLSSTVTKVNLKTLAPFPHRGGQFLSLIRQDGLARSYSMASVPELDEHVELHIREIPGGAMSGWVANQLKPGMKMSVRGPDGECFYVAGRPQQNLLLIGTGTGLAPLYAIARDALRNGHSGRIVLFHGALDESGLYLVNELRQLAQENSNFEYVPSVFGGDSHSGIRVGSLEEIVLTTLSSLVNWRVFLCGNPDLVYSLRKKCFLAGASMKDIFADAFVMKSGMSEKSTEPSN